MKKITFPMIVLFAGFFLLNSCASRDVDIVDYEVINTSNSDEALHVSLQIDDIYNPFLTRLENENFIKNFPQNDIKIIAVYEPIIDKTKTVIKKTKTIRYRTIMMLEDDVVVYNKINQIAFATNLHIDKQSSIISFDIPYPIENTKRQYVLKGIYLHSPDLNYPSHSNYLKNIGEAKYVEVFYNKIDINRLSGSQNRFTYAEPLKLEIKTGEFVKDSSETQIIKNSVLKTSLWFQDNKPLEKEQLSDEDKDDFFDELTIKNKIKLVNITIPSSMSNWHNVDNTLGSYEQGNTWEIIELVGRLSKYYSTEDKREKWIMQDGNLLYIHHDHYNHDCRLGYRIVFEKERDDRRYIFSRYANPSKNAQIELRRIYITQDNLNVFDEIKNQKEKGYNADLKLIEEYYSGELYPYREEKIAKNHDSKYACFREIDDMKRLLTTPKKELEQAFKIYKGIITKKSTHK